MNLSWPDFEAQGSCACSVPPRNTPGAGREGAFPHDTLKFPAAAPAPHTGPELLGPPRPRAPEPFSPTTTTTTCTAEATASGSPGPEALAGDGHFGRSGDAGSGRGDSWP